MGTFSLEQSPYEFGGSMRTSQGARRTTVVLAVAVVAAAAHTGPAAAGGQAACAATAPVLETLRCLINDVRAERGLAPVRASHVLSRSARLRGNAIARCRHFSHTPCGQRFATVFQQAGYAQGRYTVGENLAWGTGTYASPEQTVRRWLASPGHRAVLLSPRWRELGAFVFGAPNLFAPGQNRVWVAQFGRRG
jgi:uncharacterized protein YkwD